MRSLGRLEEGQQRMRMDFSEEKEATSDSRGRMHAKLDKLEETVTLVGQVAAQARDKAETVEKTLTHDVKPATDDFRRMRAIGLAGIALIGFAFTALGITLASVGEGAINAVRSWLRIS